MGWSEALDACMELRGVLSSWEGREWERIRAAQDPKLPREGAMLEGDTVWIAPNICYLAHHGLASWNNEPLLRSDPLTPKGFMLFGVPFGIWDPEQTRRAGKALAWRFGAAAWLVDADGVWMQFYLHRSSDLGFGGVDGKREPPHTRDLALSAFAMFWPWGATASTLGDNDDLSPRRFVAVLWRLAQQRVATPERKPADRASRRRAARAGIDDPYVVVITLRSARRSSGGEEQARDWSHRWIVGGHWRNQWYPSLETHRQIWIAPYVKGPEDKELRLRDVRAISFVR